MAVTTLAETLYLTRAVTADATALALSHEQRERDAAAGCRRMTLDEHAALFNEGGLYAGCRGWGAQGLERATYPTP